MAGYPQRRKSYKRNPKQTELVAKPVRFTPPGGWNPEFEAVFDFVVNGQGNGCIEAVAGGGKTTAVVESIIRYLDKNPKHRVLFVAFNVSIKDEGSKRLAGYGCDVLTCHGLGFRSLRKPSSWGGPDGRTQFDIQDSKGPVMQSLVEAEIGPEKGKRDEREALMDLISKAKTCLVDDVDGIVELMDRFGIDTNYDRWEFAEKALKIMDFTKSRPGTAMIQGKGRAKGKQFSKAAVTFDDQVWLPVVNDWHVDQYDAVFVDECQDLSAARRALIAKAMKPSARMFVVGDRYQCVDGNTLIKTPNGDVCAKELKAGDSVLSWRNNAVVEQTVRHVQKSDWWEGIKITTASGKTLLMSPNHKIWASHPNLKEGQHIVYMMFRKDIGFRVGITNKCAEGFGQRVHSEGAEKLWILQVCDTREDALYYEQYFSLKYGIPTCVFNSEQHGLNQNRINDVFDEFGMNGIHLLADKDMHFDFPNWHAYSTTTANKRLLIKLVAHGSKNTTLNFEWSETACPIKEDLESAGFIVTAAKKDGRFRVRKWYPNYRDAIADAETIQNIVPNSFVSEKLHTPTECLKLITASCIHTGMRVAVFNNGSVSTEEIVSIDKAEGEFYDIDVDDASNFFGGDILSHNSIYAFAGADIDSLPMLVEDFECKMLPLSCSWRCDEGIVREAQQFNPNIVARPNADEGTVDKIEVNDLLDKLVPGDVLLSRTNAPLIRLFFQLARQQRKVKFIGRDYGRMLAYRIKGWRFRHEQRVMKGQAYGSFTGRTILEYNDEWLEIQGKNRSKSEDSEGSVTDRMRDEYATVQALCSDLNNTLDSEASVKEVLDRCSAFSPDEKPDDKDGETYITLSSTHRFKGLERDHAYVLADTYKPGVDQEETNLLYVSITRAKKHLTYVKGKPAPSSAD